MKTKTSCAPLKKGDRVKIINTTMSGERIVEGMATIRSKTTTDDYYMVRFDNGDVVARFCQPENRIY